MTTVSFLIDWALRSSILILSGALVLGVFRVKGPSIRLAALIAILSGSLAIPVLMPVLPKIPLAVRRTMPPQTLKTPLAAGQAVLSFSHDAPEGVLTPARRIDWAGAAVVVYVVGAGLLLLRLCAGLVMSRRLLRTGRATGRLTGGIEIHESAGVRAPVTLGIMRPVILLPIDWREWDEIKLGAVFAHESSHIQRRDPLVQLLAAIHRALTWHSPLSWLLYQRMVRLAEEASDDAALAVTLDRESYAEVLLDFMRRGVRVSNLQGVAMARYGQPAARIGRILDGVSLSCGVTRRSVLAILTLGLPLVYVVTAVEAQVTPVVSAAAPARASEPSTAPALAAVQAEAPQALAAVISSAGPRLARSIRRYMIVSEDSSSGSWDSGDKADEQELRQKFGRHFAWFRQGRNEYVVTDANVLSELEQAQAPQREVNRKQNEVNKQQDVVNQHQSNVNGVQNSVNTMQNGVNRRQDIINELQNAKGDGELIRRLEAALAELRANKGETNDQEAVNREQAKVNEMQGRVNEEQDKVNEQQHKVNEEQERVSAQLDGKIEGMLDSAVRRGLAQELR